MEKYGTAGQATDDNTIWRMRFAFWIDYDYRDTEYGRYRQVKVRSC